MLPIVRRFFPYLALTACALAAEPALPIPELSPAVRRDEGRWSFELLPKAFQKNPQLEMTVVCELSDYGRTLPPPTPAQPVYYFGVNSGFIARGESVANEHLPDRNYLGRLLERSLRTNGFLPEDKTHAATQALLFHWGSHVAMDREERTEFPVKYYQQLLERAVLVGGQSFRKSLSQRLTFGDTLTDHTSKNDFLTDQAADDLYFVIVSAYDFAALKQHQRKLIWRANLTVSARGVSMADSLPALVLTGAPYFGRDVKDAEILFRTVRHGVVELGPSKVIDPDASLPPSK